MRLASLVLLGVLACGGSAAPPVAVLPDPQLQKGAHRVVVDGVDIAYEVRGAGPVCLVHPGGPGMDSTYLRSDVLERHFTTVYIDPAGTGTSAKLPATEKYSMARDVRIVEGLRAKLALERVCLVGHSYGGMVMQSYAVAHPKRVFGLFLYSTTPTMGEDWEKVIAESMAMFEREPWFAAAKAALDREAKMSSQAELDAIMKDEWPLYFGDWTGKHPEYRPLVASMKVSYDVFRGQREQRPFDVRKRLAVIHTTPTVILAGDRDIVAGTKPATWLAQAIGGSKLVMVRGAGHFAHVEQPAEFARAVETFAGMLR